MRHELVNKGEPVGFDPPTRLFYLVYLARILCIDCKQHQTFKRFERKKCTYVYFFKLQNIFKSLLTGEYIRYVNVIFSEYQSRNTTIPASTWGNLYKGRHHAVPCCVKFVL